MLLRPVLRAIPTCRGSCTARTLRSRQLYCSTWCVPRALMLFLCCGALPSTGCVLLPYLVPLSTRYEIVGQLAHSRRSQSLAAHRRRSLTPCTPPSCELFFMCCHAHLLGMCCLHTASACASCARHHGSLYYVQPHEATLHVSIAWVIPIVTSLIDQSCAAEGHIAS